MLYTLNTIGAGTIRLFGFKLTPDIFHYSISRTSVTFHAVPEPSTWMLLASGMGTIALRGLGRRGANV
jgi:hypothetical protein